MKTFFSLLGLLAAFTVHASTVDIVSTGSVEVVQLDYGRTFLTNAPIPLAIRLEMELDLATGEMRNGLVTVISGQNIIIGRSGFYEFQEIEFQRLEFSLAGNTANSTNAIVGNFEYGRLNLICRSSCPTVNIGPYTCAPGPAIIPVTGALTVNGTQMSFTLNPTNFLHERIESSATLNLGLGTFTFNIPELAQVRQPNVLSIRVASVQIDWNSVVGITYQPQYSSILTSNEWVDLSAPIQGTGTNIFVRDEILDQPQKFYRVVEVP